MSVKYTIKISDLTGTTTDTMVNIPINLTPQTTDQAELIKRKFIDVEVEKAINPILDYEKVRFSPTYLQSGNGINSLVNNITYNIRMLGSAGFPNLPTMYSEIGMTNDDIKFGKKRFENSFLNLSFYDTDKPITQRLLSSINIYPRLLPMNVEPWGLPKPANQIPTTFILSNPIINPDGFAEGFYIYNYKDEVKFNAPKVLYMRAKFNNASNGKTTNMMTDGVPYYIDDLVNKLYTKYVLHRNNTGYYYRIDTTYSNNVTVTGNDVTINLYEIQAL